MAAVKNAYLWARCDGYDTNLEILSDSVYPLSLIHWHPDEDEMVDVLYNLGKKGNLLVLKKTLWGTKVFFLGPSGDFSLPERRILHIGKKRRDEGMLVFLEQK